MCSKWRNTNYKAPMLFSTACCLGGNLVYRFAYDARAMWVLYAARLLTGLGEPRSILMHHKSVLLRAQRA